jgi:hypothetical protein
MDKLIVLLIYSLLVVSLPVHGQMVVSDPAAQVQLIENVKVSVEQANALNSQLKLLEETRKALSKVNQAVKELYLIDGIVENQKRVLKKSRSTYERLEKSELFSPKELNYVLMNFNEIVITTNHSLELANSILKDDMFSMGDNQRLDLLLKLSEELDDLYSDTILLEKKYLKEAEVRTIKKVYGHN